jgi:hypothetical protein
MARRARAVGHAGAASRGHRATALTGFFWPSAQLADVLPVGVGELDVDVGGSEDGNRRAARAYARARHVSCDVRALEPRKAGHGQRNCLITVALNGRVLLAGGTNTAPRTETVHVQMEEDEIGRWSYPSSGRGSRQADSPDPHDLQLPGPVARSHGYDMMRRIPASTLSPSRRGTSTSNRRSSSARRLRYSAIAAPRSAGTASAPIGPRMWAWS